MRSKNGIRIIVLLIMIIFLALGLFQLSGIETTFAENIVEDNSMCIEAEIDGERFQIKSWLDQESQIYKFFIPNYLNENIDIRFKESAKTECVFLSEIPSVYIELRTGTLDEIRQDKADEEKIYFSVFSEEGLKTNRKKGSIHARGNASFSAPRYKKSYTVDLNEADSIENMAVSSKWVLLAHYYDDTHLRDYLTFDIARLLEMQYVPNGKFINLYIDGEFQGLYFLCEKIEIATDKINIRNLEQITEKKSPGQAIKEFPYSIEGIRGGENIDVEKGYMVDDVASDISGGYLLEIEWLTDRYNEENSGFVSDKNQKVIIKSPQYASYSEVEYIKNRYQEFEDALNRSISNDTDEYIEYIELQSFVNKYLIEEVSKNMDANFSSQYLYKDSDEKDARFYAGPVWDYDRAYDNKVSEENRGADIFWVNQAKAGTDFWQRLWNAPRFSECVKETYREKLSPILNLYSKEKIWEWEEEIHNSIIADMYRYRDEYDEKMDEEKRLLREMEMLSQFIEERKIFLDKEWGNNE